MDDVTGCNHIKEGEEAIEEVLRGVKKRYSEHIIEIILLMLKFDEQERPSFIELAKLVLTSDEAHSLSTHKPMPHNTDDKFPHKSHSKPTSHPPSPPPAKEEAHENDSATNLMTQADLFKNYFEQNELIVHQITEMYWFETGGDKIGKINVLPKVEGEESPTW